MARTCLRRVRRNSAFFKPYFAPKVVHFSDGRGDFDFWINSAECGSWYEPKAWLNKPEYHELSRLIKPGDRVLEVGCNIGFTTMLLSRLVGESGFVLGLDIVPENVILAQATVFLNRASNVRLLCMGVGEAQGEIGFSNQLNGQVDSASTSRAPLTSCDDLDRQFGPFNVLKIDVEGYEGFVLKGAQGLLSRFPKLAIEIHGQRIAHYGTTVGELLHLFHAERYEGATFSQPEYRVEDFRPERLRSDRIRNLFLSPKPA